MALVSNFCTLVNRGWTATGTVRPQTITDPSVDDVREHLAWISIEDGLTLKSLKPLEHIY